MTAVLETSAKMVQLVSHNSMATHVNACLGMVDSCVRLILMNVLQTLAYMVSVEMGSTGIFVTAMLATEVLTVTSILTIVNPGEFFILLVEDLLKKDCGSNSTRSISHLNILFHCHKYFIISCCM